MRILIFHSSYSCSLKLLSILILLCFSFSKTYSQPYADFSGKWVINNQKCTPPYNSQVTYVITQENEAAMTFETITISKSTGKPRSIILTFSLNGNAVEKELFGEKYKSFSSWSDDHKSFSQTDIDYKVENGITREYTNIFSYSLSDDGKTLVQTNKSKFPSGDGYKEKITAVLVFDKVE
jgi:hypothetical protein